MTYQSLNPHNKRTCTLSLAVVASRIPFKQSYSLFNQENAKADAKKRKVAEINANIKLRSGDKMNNVSKEVKDLEEAQKALKQVMAKNDSRLLQLRKAAAHPRPLAKARAEGKVASTTESGDSTCTKPAVPRPAA